MKDSKVEHLIVLMMENRSFDHMLGYMDYTPEKGFEGVKGREKSLGNPLPGKDELAFPGPGASYAMQFGPNHSHDSVMRQLLGSNRRALPYQLTNNGFAEDYEGQFAGHGADALQCFPPDKLPVLSKLAQSFAVCDHWFCSVPGATWPNRNFAHSATSDGEANITTRLYFNWTIYQQLSAGERDWAVYYGGFPAQTMAFSELWFDLEKPSWLQRFKPMEKLYRAIEHDRLPHYAFVEPDMLGIQSNSQHPSIGGEVSFKAGEHLMWQLYDALRRSPEVFNKTLLLILYDEHGGFFDHVPPPQGPEYAMEQGFEDPTTHEIFCFDLLGPRVPAVLISPWIEPGTVDHTEYEHASIPATARKIAGVADKPLTNRDARANTFEQVLTLTAPRSADLPVDIAEPVVDESRRDPHEQVELEKSQVDLLSRLIWEHLGEQMQARPRAAAERVNFGLADSAAADSEAVHQEIMNRVGSRLSEKAQAVLDQAKPEEPPQPAFALGGIDLQGFGLDLLLKHAQAKIEGLLNHSDLIDEAMRFADLFMREFFEEHNVILRTVDGSSLEQPADDVFRRELAALFDSTDANANLWLADYQDRWLTIYQNGRATFEDLGQSYERDGVTEESGLRLLTSLRAGDLGAVTGRMRKMR